MFNGIHYTRRTTKGVRLVPSDSRVCVLRRAAGEGGGFESSVSFSAQIGTSPLLVVQCVVRLVLKKKGGIQRGLLCCIAHVCVFALL